jgi:hypothetical protein
MPFSSFTRSAVSRKVYTYPAAIPLNPTLIPAPNITKLENSGSLSFKLPDIRTLTTNPYTDRMPARMGGMRSASVSSEHQ